MKVGPLDVIFHRTVRIKEGRVPAALPPSLGRFDVQRVADYKDRCPESWDPEGVFFPIQDTEAMWMSFSCSVPLAVMIGAGGINAVNGEKLGTKLEKDGYCVCPRQPWIDGFKSDDGSVYQFVSTEYKKGDGLTVGEQLLGKESKSGGIGIAVFEAKDPRSLEELLPPEQYNSFSEYQTKIKSGKKYFNLPPLEFCTVDAQLAPASYSAKASLATPTASVDEGLLAMNDMPLPPKSASMTKGVRTKGSTPMKEMGLGKGGTISQKIYEDPHGVEVWKDTPTAALAVYLISAEQFSEITGKPLPKVVDQSEYNGIWWNLKDEEITDVEGTSKFAGLKSVFAGDTTNVETEAPQATPES